jgi:phosphoglycerate dehydrogenase-like enzyme
MARAIYILAEATFNSIYGKPERESINSLLHYEVPFESTESILGRNDCLPEVEMIFTGWNGPKMDDNFLARVPNLKMVFYGAGSIRGIVTDAFWDRKIRITSAYVANAVPVAEFTLSQILFCLKCGWQFVRTVREDKTYKTRYNVHGGYQSTVGLISLGMVARHVCKLLKSFDINVLAYDPFVSPETASNLNVTLCNLDEIFSKADVVSLHTPWLKETEGMITGQYFKQMKPYSAFINTARGAVVRENEMIEVLKTRPDLQAVIDATWPEPPSPDSPLYTLPNVALTPHIAGSMDNECRRMGRMMADELSHYLNNEPLEWEITREKASRLA